MKHSKQLDIGNTIKRYGIKIKNINDGKVTLDPKLNEEIDRQIIEQLDKLIEVLTLTKINL